MTFRPLSFVRALRGLATLARTFDVLAPWHRPRRVLDRADVFELVATSADALARHLVGEPQELARVIAPAARAAGYLIAAGFDPAFEIARALARDPVIRIARSEYAGAPESP
jgi:hypothetical protein